MEDEIRNGQFTSKYALGEIVEMKNERSDIFAEVRGIVFSLDGEPSYFVRHYDGRMLQLAESEICIKGVDYNPD